MSTKEGVGKLHFTTEKEKGGRRIEEIRKKFSQRFRPSSIEGPHLWVEGAWQKNRWGKGYNKTEPRGRR